MRRRAIALLLAGLAAPAAAQHTGHGAAAADPHAGHAAPRAPEPPRPQADPHAGHAAAAADPHTGHSVPPAAPEPPAPQADPHAGHGAAAKDAHAGHATAAADPHAGHARGNAAALPPAIPPSGEAHSGPAHAADLIWNPADMAASRAAMLEEHGGMTASRVLLDRLEARIRDGGDGYGWDAEAWYGGDRDKLWLKSEGEGGFGDGLEGAEVQALWSRAVDPWFDLQLGLRQDFGPGPNRTYAVAGLQGLAPYWFELDGAFFLSDQGEVTARLEAEYDLRITQKLILQPRAEFGFSLQDMPALRTGPGFTQSEIGLRLRYELRPEFAPYLGIQYERAFGRTADYRRLDAEDADGLSLLLGVRAWF
jgi:copper resistance protein B